MGRRGRKKHALTAGVSSVLLTLCLGACAGPPPCDCAPLAAADAASPTRPPPSEGASDRGRVHAVRPGDTLLWIAKGWGVTAREIARLNDIENPHHIVVGDRLKLPAGAQRIYRVQPGDTLSAIAARHTLPVSTIVERNRLPDSALQPGQVLRMPDETPLPASPLARIDSGPSPSGEASLRRIRADALLGVAEEQYRAAHFELALERARDALLLLEGDEDREEREKRGSDLRPRIHFIEGSALAGLGQDEAAREAFARARSIDPGFDPPSEWLSPRIRSLYRPESDGASD